MPCVTHHYACPCREKFFATLIDDANRYRAMRLLAVLEHAATVDQFDAAADEIQATQKRRRPKLASVPRPAE